MSRPPDLAPALEWSPKHDGVDHAPLSVVIVTYNSADVLGGLLDSLTEGLQGVAAHEVIVVDNASHDGSADFARAHPAVARVIETGRNGGYSAGINAAIATIDPGSDLLVLNPDIRLKPGSVRVLQAAMARSPRAGVVVPQVRNENGVITKSVRREPSIVTAWSEALLGGTRASKAGLGEVVEHPALYRNGGRIAWASGAILLISSRARRIVGKWDESYFLYSEEVDYLQRVRATGFTVLYVPEAQAIHIGGDYHGSSFLTSLMMANRIIYYRRHHNALSTIIFRLGLIIGECIRLPSKRRRSSALGAALGIWKPHT